MYTNHRLVDSASAQAKPRRRVCAVEGCGNLAMFNGPNCHECADQIAALANYRPHRFSFWSFMGVMFLIFVGFMVACCCSTGRF